MAWRITFTSGAEMHAPGDVHTPEGKQSPADLGPGDLVCLFPDGSMPVEVQTIEEV